MTSTTERDPFDTANSAPSMSFKDAPVGTVRKMRADGPAALVQQRDYNTGDPSFWDTNRKGVKTTTPNDTPCMAAVINGVDLDNDEEPISLWCPIPSALFTAVKEAQQKAAAKITTGSEIAVKFSGEKPNDDPKKHAQKLYAAKVTPPVETPTPDADAFGEPPF